MIQVNGNLIEQNHFPDGTLNIKLPTITKSAIDILWNYENDAELFTLICIRRHYAKKSAILYMDYIPHARMDRVKKSDDVFTLKYFCEVINSLDFSEVIVLDPHSNVAPALIENVIVLNPDSQIDNVICDIHWDIGGDAELVAFYPDEGAMKRYSDYATLPYAFGVKKRDWATGKIEGLEVMNSDALKDKAVLIIDDICSRGGTFYYSAKAIKEYTDKDIYLYITHCEKTIFEGDLIKSGLVKKIYTANALFEIPKEYKDIIIEL